MTISAPEPVFSYFSQSIKAGKTRLKAFHEEKGPQNPQHETELRPLAVADEQKAHSSTLSPPLEETKRTDEQQLQQQQKRTTPGPAERRETKIESNQDRSKKVERTKEKDDGAQGSGGLSFSTFWENMKRMMGFSPDCQNDGYRSIGSRSCTCPQFFDGQFCERLVCANNGTRVRVAAFGGEEVCKCPHPDYVTGKHCELVHCQNGGRLLNDGTCHCVDGWYTGQFCQHYTSSWLIAFGIPLLAIAAIIFCCVICRMDLCAIRRTPPPRVRHGGDRRGNHGRRRHPATGPNNCGGRSNSAVNNRSRRAGQRQQMCSGAGTGMQQQLCIQQNLLNEQHRNQEQYVLRLEQIPVYNPQLHIPPDAKPLDPPPPYDQAILCPPPQTQGPPNYTHSTAEGRDWRNESSTNTSRESSAGSNHENSQPHCR